MKRVAYQTFGCRLNQYDTETLRTLIEGEPGWVTVPASEEADVYLVNTCSVTARADATCRKAIRRIHSAHPNASIVVTGCYAQRAPEELSELPGISLVLGAANRSQVVGKLAHLAPGQVEVAVSPIQEAKTFLDVPISEMMEHSRAYVKVQEGCNEACTFCIVPRTRGASRSRSPHSVVAQVRELVSRGYVEIVLTGVHVGDYGGDLSESSEGSRSLTGLIREILEIPGLARFRLSSIEPASVSSELIELAASSEKFARHFHIPFQSGSDSVLERMKRRYTASQYRELVRHIHERIPGCGIGADVICGFPGETDECFQETFDTLVDLPVTYVHAFGYSVRPGSEAEAYGDQVDPQVKKRRVQALKRLMREKAQRFREAHVGQTLTVLIENDRRAGKVRLSGWTDNYIKVDVQSAHDGIEGLHPVQMVGMSDEGLIGELSPALSMSRR